jgi:hypothetical protein
MLPVRAWSITTTVMKIATKITATVMIVTIID